MEEMLIPACNKKQGRQWNTNGEALQYFLNGTLIQFNSSIYFFITTHAFAQIQAEATGCFRVSYVQSSACSCNIRSRKRANYNIQKCFYLNLMDTDNCSACCHLANELNTRKTFNDRPSNYK